MRARLLAVALVLLAGCDGGAPEPTVEVESCAAAGGTWTRVNRLRGFLLHDGLVGRDSCEVLLVGEQMSPRQRGVVLRSRDGGRTLHVAAAFPQTLHLSAVAASGGTVWVGGDTHEGTAFLRRSDDGGRTWSAVQLPRAVTAVQELVAGPNRLCAAGSAGRAAIVVAGDGRGAWRELARVPSRGGRIAYFNAASIRESAIAFAGTDGRAAVVLLSRDGGEHFERVDPPRLAAATGVALTSASAGVVAGYEGVPEAGAGVLLSLSLGRRPAWSRVPAPAGSPGDVQFESPVRGWLALARRSGSVIVATPDGGRTWRETPIAGHADPPPFVETLVVGSAKYALTVGGLYRLRQGTSPP